MFSGRCLRVPGSASGFRLRFRLRAGLRVINAEEAEDAEEAEEAEQDISEAKRRCTDSTIRSLTCFNSADSCWNRPPLLVQSSMTPSNRAREAMAGRTVVQLEREPADTVRAAILDGLRAFNRRHAEAPGFEPLVLSARDEGGEIVGGLVGVCGWHWLHVDLLWVDEAHRGAGVGRRLLREAEAEARRRGVRHVDLDTFDFQARPFYEREGYVVFGALEDYPPGHTRYFMKKDLEVLADGA